MKFAWFLTLVYIVSCTYGSKILGLFPLPRETHFHMYEKLMKGLVSKGHDVHVVSYFPQKIKIPRYTDIDLRTNIPFETHNLTVAVIENYGLFETANYMFKEYGTEMCEKTFQNPAIIELAKTRQDKKYDLIITEVFGSDCLLGFAYLFKAPIVGIMGDSLVPWAIDRMGNPDNPSYMPNYLLPFGSKMSLQDRILNVFSGLAYRVGYQLLSVIPSELKARKLFGSDLTPIDVLAYNTSLLLVNSHFSINFPRPLVPGIIEIAGLHIGDVKPLPASLDKFTKMSKSLIYVALQTDAMTRDKINIVVDTLSTMSNPVIWRGPRNRIFGQTPKNFYVDEFELEKLDVLCNTNTGLLITNGDLYDIQEAIHCGIPIIFIPIIADHEIYVRDYVSRGLALGMAYETLNSTNISNAVNAILQNSMYKHNAKQYSTLFRDRPIKPMEEALFWIQYVIRHSGAKHLRTVGADLIWLEYYNVDVGLVFFGFFLLVLFIVFLINYFLNEYQRKNSLTGESTKKDK